MDSSTSYLSFVPGVLSPHAPLPDDLWFVFRETRMLFREAKGALEIPTTADIASVESKLLNVLYLGLLHGRSCCCALLDSDQKIPAALTEVELRAAIFRLDEERHRVCGKALQMLSWDGNHRFCGRCGVATQSIAHDRSKVCPQCGMRNYPRISPAVIVAVVKNGSLLLARNKNFKLGFYSVLAGFVEPGESFEECVRREVFEETGIELKNIRYFGSQPWPFPDSLMVAFTAEHASNEIRIDNDEIIAADWYTPDKFPPIPPVGSISRKLIDWYVEHHK